MLLFIVNSVLLGFGLAMDAFSVSLVSGMQAPRMRTPQKIRIAGTFAGFQFLMPMAGWFCVRTIMEIFTPFQKATPWIALILLLYIGGNMIREDLSHRQEPEGCGQEQTLQGKNSRGPDDSGTEMNGRDDGPDTGTLVLQGIATSIDALSVGFTIAGYRAAEALLCSLLIGGVTYIICRGGLRLGARFGTRIAGKAQLLGGVILIAIGLEIFLKGVLLTG